MPLVAIPNGIALVSDPTMWKISVGGKVFLFEWHHYCGPTALNKRTRDPLADQPGAFLDAVTLWNQQGRKVDEETGLCIYFHEPKPITQRIGGRHYKITGWQEPVRGS